MLATLEQRHRELTALMISMHELISNDEIDHDAVTRTRLGLSRASAARSTFLMNMVYPALLNALAGAEASVVRDLQGARQPTGRDHQRTSPNGTPRASLWIGKVFDAMQQVFS